MSSVTEHHGEEEWEGDDCEGCRVNFSIAGYTIRINNSLETGRKLVGSVVSWWNFASGHAIQNWWHGTPTALLLKRREKYSLKTVIIQ